MKIFSRGRERLIRDRQLSKKYKKVNFNIVFDQESLFKLLELERGIVLQLVYKR